MNKPRGTTGPTTEQGKRVASRNAAKHNCTSKSLIVKGENPDDFAALLHSLTREYQPETEMQQTTVMEAARAAWDLARVNREFDKSQQALYDSEENMRQWTTEQHAECERMLRYRTRAERAYARALQAVEHLRKLRLQAEQRAYWEKFNDTRLAQADRRIALSAMRASQTVERVPKEPRAPKEKEGDRHPLPWPEPLIPLSQAIEIRVLDGLISAAVHPSAQEMRQQADVAAPGAPVLRRFEFPDGIPAEYAWVNQPGVSRSGIVWTQSFETVQAWRAHVDREAAGGTGRFLAVKETPTP